MKNFIILLLMLLITSPVFAKTYIFKYYPNGLLVKIGDMDVIHDLATGRIKAITNDPIEEVKKKF